jgi:hypothetical protein
MKTLFAPSSKRFLTIILLAFSSVGSTRSVDIGPAPSRVLVVQNYYYALPGKATEVYQWRLHASEVRAKLGLPRGRVLRRLPDPETDKQGPPPDVIWECEYSSLKARDADVARLDKSTEFAAVEKHMDTLIQDFRRMMFEAAT